jgi:uncharacterized membrane protein
MVRGDPLKWKFWRIAWIVVPLVLAIVGLEIGMLTLPHGTERLLSVGEIVCGLAIVVVIARALLRR